MNYRAIALSVVVLSLAVRFGVTTVAGAHANWQWAKACDAESARTGSDICSLPLPGSSR